MDLESIVREFLVESYENLDTLDRALVALEQDPADDANLASIFRTIHTIKGTAGFFGFCRLEAVSHVGENLLSRLRDRALDLTPEITSGLLAMVDAIRAQLAAIEAGGAEADADYTALIAWLTRLTESPGEAPPAAAPAPAHGRAAALPAGSAPAAAVPFSSALESEALAAADPRSARDRRSGQDRRSGGVADGSLRVDVGLLDQLMNLVSELVLVRNQIVQFTASRPDPALVSAVQRLNLVTSELQDRVMKTRVQPIGTLWSRFPRLVRDLAQTCGKQVRTEMVGEDTDLDRSILEAIRDPLTHVVRNAVDHGIETPQVRLAAGKRRDGLLTLRAFHQGGQIIIEIADDGGGIDPAKVRAKAVERGLVGAEQAARMSDREVLRMIFLPGLSTAERITHVSGRGVGMDVVRTNIEKIGGTVEVQSTPGAGTSLRIRIPLTVAIIPALTVAGASTTTPGRR